MALPVEFAQKLLVSECACRPDFMLCTIDIEKAFLQGMSVEEVSEATGTPQEETYFTLPSGSAAILRKIKGFESYSEHTHVLFALKASTGTVGAPRAFSLKTAKITRGPPFYLHT